MYKLVRMIEKLQIVSLNVPYPPNYGGVIDIFYKIKALHQLTIKIILHSFIYDRPRAPELEQYCETVYYYDRKKPIFDFFSKTPFIVKTRNHSRLLKNLSNHQAPVLFEGLHSCYFLSHKKLVNLTKIVRTHNIEHEYYAALKDSSNNFLTRLYFDREAKKLSNYEGQLTHANALACISPDDTDHFQKKFKTAHYIPAFHPFEKVVSHPGQGKYILFHGNLEVEENQKALDFILREVMPTSFHRLIVAGKSPSKEVKKRIASNSKWKLVENPPQDEMDNLIKNAHISLIPTFQSTGLKLKLLASLFAGRFVVTNPPMVTNTGLEELCIIGNSAAELKLLVDSAMQKEFTKNDIDKRKATLENSFSTLQSAKKLLDLF